MAEVEERRAPVYPYWEEKRPGTVTWAEHAQAVNDWDARWGKGAGPNPERVAAAGGVDWHDYLLMYGRPPLTWRSDA